MKLTWCGHSCFLLESRSGSVVFDPYAPGSVPGLVLPTLRADAVICSHEHADHFYPEGVELSGRKPDFEIRQFDCWHDDAKGAKRGKNMMTLVEADGLRVLHMGDLGHMLSPEQLAALGRVDVLLIPVGGFYTIDARQAAELAKKIAPAVTVPMHYCGDGFGYDVIVPVGDFLRLMDKVVMLDGNVIEPEKLDAPVVAVPKCPRG